MTNFLNLIPVMCIATTIIEHFPVQMNNGSPMHLHPTLFVEKHEINKISAWPDLVNLAS